jgi:antitoxin component YwqK of YwqJK toxin-antitoxin module
VISRLSNLLSQLSTLVLLVPWLLSCEQQKRENFESYHPNGTIEWTGTLVNGKKTGEWTLRDSLGHMDRIQRYENDTCVYRQLYLNGNVLTNEQMKGEDTKHGERIVLYEDGNTESKTSYIMNYQYGHQIVYFRNGQIYRKYFQDSTTMRGFEQYYPNGNILALSDDTNDGIVHFHDSLGNPTIDVKYANMVIQDTIRTYNESK